MNELTYFYMTRCFESGKKAQGCMRRQLNVFLFNPLGWFTILLARFGHESGWTNKLIKLFDYIIFNILRMINEF